MEQSVRVEPYGELVAYIEHRPSRESRPPVIAVHGYMDSAGAFDVIGPAIAAAAQCRVLALDLPGHGRSEHTGRYTMPQMAQTVVSFARALSIPAPLRLIGHSYGGEVASLIAGAAPELVGRAVFLDNGFPPPAVAEGETMGPFGIRRPLRASIGKLLRSAHAGQSRPRQFSSIEAAISARLEASQASIFPLDSTAASNIHRRNYRAVSATSAAVLPGWDRELLTNVELNHARTSLESDLEIQRHIVADCLLIQFDTWVGETSLWARQAVMQALVGVTGRMRIARVPGPHHAFALAGAPSEQVAQLAIEFLTSADSSVDGRGQMALEAKL